MTRPSDFAFFRLLARSASFTDAARSLSMTPSAVSRRLHAIESRLGTELVLRNTRSMRLTPQGERYLEAAETILRETERLEADIASRPLGRLRICASFGFGRTHIAPVVADFATANPDVRVDLTLTDRPVSIIEEGFDVGIHLGLPHDSRLRAPSAHRNRRRRKHGRPLDAYPPEDEEGREPRRRSDSSQQLGFGRARLVSRGTRNRASKPLGRPIPSCGRAARRDSPRLAHARGRLRLFRGEKTFRAAARLSRRARRAFRRRGAASGFLSSLTFSHGCCENHALSRIRFRHYTFSLRAAREPAARQTRPETSS